MTNSKSFRINSPKVIRETIDGEVVIVHLEKGYYYSLMETGAVIWEGIERGIYKENLIEEMTEQYDANPKDIKTTVDNFFERLQQEELIVLDQKNTSKMTSVINQTKTIASKEKVRFDPPVLQKYTDMEDLLVLDPIHEVDEMGWPSAKQA